MEGANTIVPSRFHVPPQRPIGASHRIRTAALPTSTMLSFPSAKKPMRRLSGDQKGNIAPSVPFSCCALEAENVRTHSLLVPSSATATKAMRAPSGETEKLPRRKDESEGGSSEERTAGTG